MKLYVVVSRIGQFDVFISMLDVTWGMALVIPCALTLVVFRAAKLLTSSVMCSQFSHISGFILHYT